MTSLILTQEQQDNLLKMCKVLFPNYVDIIISGLYVRLVTQWEDLRGQHTKQEYIPWFEFAIIHLAKEIYNKGNYYRNYVSFSQFVGWICTIAEHPIDYLYEHFKKLK